VFNAKTANIVVKFVSGLTGLSIEYFVKEKSFVVMCVVMTRHIHYQPSRQMAQIIVSFLEADDLIFVAMIKKKVGIIEVYYKVYFVNNC
jgi:hypothetical protein